MNTVYYWATIEAVGERNARGIKTYLLKFNDGDKCFQSTNKLYSFREAVKAMKEEYLTNDPPPKDWI
jgi:hypothetical protein